MIEIIRETRQAPNLHIFSKYGKNHPKLWQFSFKHRPITMLLTHSTTPINQSHASLHALINQSRAFFCMQAVNSRAVMAAYMSSDARAAKDSEGSSSGFCLMYVINTHSKVIPVSEKSSKKFQECAAKWIDVEGSPESKVAVKAL